MSTNPSAIGRLFENPLVQRIATAAAGAAVLGASLTGCGPAAPDASCDAPLPSHLSISQNALTPGTALDVYGTGADGQTYKYGTISQDFNVLPSVTLKNTCGEKLASATEQFRLGSTIDDVFIAPSKDGRTAGRELQLEKQTWDSGACAAFSGGSKACSVFNITEDGKAIGVSVKTGESTGTGGVAFQIRDPQTKALEATMVRSSNTTLGHVYESDVLNEKIPNELPVLIAGLKSVKDANQS